MENQRIIRRASLGLINFGAGICIKAIGSQTIHRFRGERYHFATADKLSCFMESFLPGFDIIYLNTFRLHVLTSYASFQAITTRSIPA